MLTKDESTPNKNKLIDLYYYIDSKNSHGKNKLCQKMESLGLKETQLYWDIYHGPTSNGKNTLIRLLLVTLINKIKG